MKTSRILVIAILMGLSGVCRAQVMDQEGSQSTENVRPFRIGLKLGFPNIIGGNVEYVTPLINHKLSVNLDYSKLDYGFLSDLFVEEQEEDETTNLTFTYFQGGLNYYFFKPGKGLYAGVNYGALKLEFTETDLESSEDPGKTGVATMEFKRNSFSLKLGAKLGGLFYFRPEIGYAFEELPKSVDTKVRFDDGSTETQTYYLDDYFDTESSPQKYLFEGFIANIGFGFSF
ncbi:hypothetical protein RM553_09560 [Zunongwangia sp. F363]|uniref:Outer membrane protein beta-barrel domain-containing protein n=1 Tax=Autumnicola tepida TaxID=3075595 RepID=A0ABU3C9R0_9FLAO|nr:hypothetical protein [Zunongwangia sp. F363]MDT0643072.1 hypothetical protein [Zunongwangia sp. F363]